MQAIRRGHSISFEESPSKKMSSSGNTYEVSETTINEFMETKWRSFFRFLDLDRNGVVSFADYELLATRFADMATFSEHDSEEIRKRCLKWWWVMEKTVGQQRENMHEDQFVDAIKRLLTSPHVNAQYTMLGAWEAMFDVVDTNYDGRVNTDDLVLFYRCHGIADAWYVENVFRNLDQDKDGFVTRKEFVSALQGFWFGENPNDDYSFMFSGKTQQNSKQLKNKAKSCPWLRKAFCCFP